MEAQKIAASADSAYINPTLAIRELRAYTKHLLGRTLTIIDAALPPGQQNKATKDLLHAAFWQEHYTPAADWCERATHAGEVPCNVFPFCDDIQLNGSSAPTLTT